MCKNNCDCKKCFNDNICDECKVRTTTNCITVNNELPNIGSDAGEVLTTVLEMIDDQLGNPPVVPAVYIENIGTGSELYKGMSNLGYQQFRTLLSGTEELTIVEGTNEITFNVDLPAPPTIPTYSASNAGNLGIGVYKNNTVVGNNTQFNFKNIVATNTGATGTELLNAVSDTSDNITISAKKIASDSLIITESAGIINIETPTIVDIPRFIVNSASQAPTEDGTLSKPYKTVQGALTAFVGTGTAISPQFAGAEIVIQKGVGYNFTGNFNYNNVTIILEEGSSINSNPSASDYICNYDALADVPLRLQVILKDKASILLNKSGFKNSGTTTATSNFSNTKSIEISGTGSIVQVSTSVVSNIYSILESNYTSTNTFNNDGATQISVSGITLLTNTQSLYKIGGNSRIFIDRVNLGIQGATSLPTSTQFFSQLGGISKISDSNLEIISVLPITLDRIFTVSKSASINTNLILNNCKISGKMVTLFENMSALQPTVQAVATRTEFFQCTNIAKSSSVMWTQCLLFNNIFVTGIPDFTQIDLTAGNFYSTYNIFNSNVSESLRVFSSRASAVSGGLKKGDKFINTAGVTSPTTGWIIDMIME